MKSYFQEIEKKLKKNIQSESLEIIDNSYLHKSHKSFLYIILLSNILLNNF